MMEKSSFVLSFGDVDMTEVGLAGERGTNLGEMVKNGFPVSKGFVLSSRAYFAFIRENKLAQKIKDIISTAHFERPDSLMQVSSHIKRLIMHGTMSEDLVKDIFFAYRKLSGIFRDAVVEVRFSPTGFISGGIDVPDVHLGRVMPFDKLRAATPEVNHTKGEANLILKIKEGWASLFAPAAILYRHEKKMDHFRIGMAIVVQKTFKPECYGVMFTADPVTNDKKKIVIEARRTKIIPDQYEVRKADLEIINRVIAGKQKLTHNQILNLAMLGKRLERHYYFPQEIEWVMEKNKIYIVETRPIKGMGVGRKFDTTTSRLQLFLKGVPASAGIVTAPVKIVANVKEIDKVDVGDVMVAVQTNSDYIKAMKKAAAIITDHGGRSSYSAIQAREFGIPAVVGAGSATRILKDGMVITINGALGEVYKGSAKQSRSVEQSYFKTATKVYADLSQPGLASMVARKNVDGVGILRGEFLMVDIAVHPRKSLRDGKGHIYSKRLAEQIGVFCKDFAARPVVYCASDSKTNEYRDLEGGGDFEPLEANPILGYRGAFRHIQDPEVFKLELEAVKIVRHTMGFKNLWMMVPFCRSVGELVELKKIMSQYGIYRSPTFKLWMMIEVPANVILLDKFIEEGIDGVLIGLDNLTALLLGIDPNNSEVAAGFDQRNPAILWALEQTIKTCHKHLISSSLSGQAAYLYPDLLEKLVEWGISSFSVYPEVIESVREKIFTIERQLIYKRDHGKN